MLTVRLDDERLKEVAGDAARVEAHIDQRLLTSAVLRVQLLRLAMKGVNATRAAEMLGCAPETARRHYADPTFRRAVLGKVDDAFVGVDAAFAEQKKTLHERLAEKADKAFEELCVLLDSQNTPMHLKVKIAQDFLDRNPETQAGFVQRHGKFDPEQLAAASRVAREMDNVVSITKAS